MPVRDLNQNIGRATSRLEQRTQLGPTCNFDAMPRDNIHDLWRERVVGWNAERMQATAHTGHQSGTRTSLNDRRDEAHKFRKQHARRRCQFGMNEVDTIKM